MSAQCLAERRRSLVFVYSSEADLPEGRQVQASLLLLSDIHGVDICKFLMDLFIVLLCFLLFTVGLLVSYMPNQEEQRTNIKFLVQTGQNPTQIWRTLVQVYGAEALSYPQVRLWHKQFKDGRDTPKDNPRSGRPASRLNSLDEIQNSVHANCRKMIHEVALEVNRPPSTVFKVMKKDLKMRKLCPKFVPHFLSDQNKQMRVDLSNQCLNFLWTVPRFLDCIVSGDETWISLYNQETKFESCQWTEKGGPCPQKIVKSNLIRKTWMILFHDAYGPLHVDFFPRGETIDSGTTVMS